MRFLRVISLSLLIVCFLLTMNLYAAQRAIKVTAKTPDGKQIPLYKGSYALIMGNEKYTGGWDPLPGATRDVKDVAEALKRNGFQVTFRTNLTRNEFNRELGAFCHKYGRDKDNRLLFYFAGHGHTREMATGEDLGYLVMVDAPAPEKDPVGFSLSSVDMQSIVTQAKMIKARHVLFMFDSCFSGSILNLRERVVPQNISDSISLPVRQFITAGRANEPVPDHSIFKQAFLDLLEGRDKEPIPDGYITGEELGLYLKNKVPEYNPAQHPQYGKINDIRLDKGDFVFALKSPPLIPGPQKPPGITDYDKVIHEREAKTKWNQWQESMEKDFAKAETYDQSKELSPEEKLEVWTSFLSSYGADNPYSSKDDELMEKAWQRHLCWKLYEDHSSLQQSSDTNPLSPTNEVATQGNYLDICEQIDRLYVELMEKDFAKAERYDRNGELTPAEKAEAWASFLSSYGADNPDISQYDELMVKAGQRYLHWKLYEARSLPQKPSFSRPSSTSNVTERDGVYVAYANGTVRDTRTGLEWVAGPDKDMTWDEAKSWVEGLTVGGGGWRMPAIQELRSLYEDKTGARNMTSLLKTTGWSVWSGEAKDSSARWAFLFNFGNKISYGRDYSYDGRAFAVRSRSDE